MLHEEYFTDKMEEVYKNFLRHTRDSRQRSFVDFIEYWVARDEKLKIDYEGYDRALERAAKAVAKSFVKETCRDAVDELANNRRV